MTQQEQQDRCVLTRHDVQSIKDLVFILNDNAESSTQKAIFEILSNNMRSSHPHTPAAPSHDEALSGLLSENARLGAELKRVTDQLQRLNGEHDATIRNQTLDAFAREIQQRYVGNYDNEAGDIPEVPIDEIAEIIESLRHQSTEARK